MRRPRVFIATWFAVLLICNILMLHGRYSNGSSVQQLHPHELLAIGASVEGAGILKQVLEAVGYMTTPSELLISALIILLIWKTRASRSQSRSKVT